MRGHELVVVRETLAVSTCTRSRSIVMFPEACKAQHAAHPHPVDLSCFPSEVSALEQKSIASQRADTHRFKETKTITWYPPIATLAMGMLCRLFDTCLRMSSCYA